MNKMFHTRLGAAAIMLALGVNAPVNAESAALPAPAPVPAPTTTVWNRLGIPQAFHKMRDSTTNRRGNRPESERTDPLKRIADPANLDSPNPAIKKAAEVKADQDLAPQKIKAIKYLATVGCDCYPGVKDALLASLDDCTEAVRYEAAVAFCQAAGNPCCHCAKSCCNAKVMEKLHDVAYGQDESGCYKEASARVRAAAEMALNACRRKVGATTEPRPIEPPKGPKERSSNEPTPAPIPEPKPLPVNPPNPSASDLPPQERKPSVTLRILPESGDGQEDTAVRQATATEPSVEK